MTLQQLHDRLLAYLGSHLDGRLPRMLFAGNDGYDQARQLFNRRFDYYPAAIVYVESSVQASALVRFAKLYPTEIFLRLRSGGHDHEGESSGDGVLLLDFSAMQEVSVGRMLPDGEAEVSVEPGLRFGDLKAVLDRYQLAIAHGTCSTVGVTGYILGGGWGPWTRRHGMGCERLIGATLVLGDGEIVEINQDDAPDSASHRLLWALRGGGGMSYGIVTRLRFRAFHRPDLPRLHSFCLEINDADVSALWVLQRWEELIATDSNPALLGSSLRIAAHHLADGAKPDLNAALPCVLYGYAKGSELQVRHMIDQCFGPGWGARVVFDQLPNPTDNDKNDATAANTQIHWHFEGWDGRHHRHQRHHKSQGIVLETAGPAPHKLTSRVAGVHWSDDSRSALIHSLQSPLVPAPQETAFPAVAFVTLLAISGPYYADQNGDADGCAFPYRNDRYFIQYQAWWNQFTDMNGRPVGNAAERAQACIANRYHDNRLQDWIANCRDYDIPGSHGAFISFKDVSIRTEVYFGTSYQRLRAVKLECSRDPQILLQTAKTIV